MGCATVLKQLKKLSSAQTAKTYRRHGASNAYGVSFAAIYKLQKQIKRDHALAMELWDSGVAEARILGALVADPTRLTGTQAEKWMKDVNWHCVGGYLAGLVAASPVGLPKMVQWMKSSKEHYREAGYNILAHRLKDGAEVSDAECRAILKTIEREIHSSANHARNAMNGALIAIGIYRPALRREALETAKRIGKVDVDHGDTACKTPDAAAYIQKAVGRARAASA